MASLVQRNQKGALEPVERFPMEEGPTPQLPATSPQRAAEEFLDTLAFSKSTTLPRAFVGALSRLAKPPAWNPTAKQKQQVLHIALTIMKYARNERLQLQAARLVADLCKQDDPVAIGRHEPDRRA